MYVVLAILAGFATLYSIVAARVERTWISGPIVFTLFGLVVGRTGLGWIDVGFEAETLKVLAELTLALVLFTDASGVDLRALKRFKQLPIRLLLIGLPLTILLGYGAGVVFFPDMPVFEVALLAIMLAPTDAALGKAVVSNEAVPDPVREGLNVESGLNDGICVPILLLFLGLAAGESGGPTATELFLEVIGVGVLSGVGITYLAVGLLRVFKGELSETWDKVTVVTLAFTCFGAAQAMGGSGFIASFVGGVLFGALMKSEKEELLESAEGVGDTFSLLTWVLFGAAVVGPTLHHFSWPVVGYALLSLTLVRMLPVYLVVFGLEKDNESKLFIGWFGPRGLASIVFIVMVGEKLHNQTLVGTVAWTVLLSIVLHGVTANPWAKAYGARHAG